MGISYGWQFKHKTIRRLYHGDTILKYKKGEISATPAFFLGPQVIKLDAGSTEPDITVDRNVVGIGMGGMIVFGINNFNLGIALGWDKTVGGGTGIDSWIYEGKPWTGLVLGFDFIK